VDQIPVQYAVGLVVVVLLVLRRLRPAPLTYSRLLILPIVVAVMGTVGLMIFGGSVAATLPNVLFVVIDVGLSAGLGVVRAWTVRVDGGSRPRRYRYTLLTVVLWGVSILVRIVVGVIGRLAGTADFLVGGTVLAMLGLSLLVQNCLILVLQRRLSGDDGRRAVSAAA